MEIPYIAREIQLEIRKSQQKSRNPAKVQKSQQKSRNPDQSSEILVEDDP